MTIERDLDIELTAISSVYLYTIIYSIIDPADNGANPISLILRFADRGSGKPESFCFRDHYDNIIPLSIYTPDELSFLSEFDYTGFIGLIDISRLTREAYLSAVANQTPVPKNLLLSEPYR